MDYELPAILPPSLERFFAVLGMVGTGISGLALVAAVVNGAIAKVYGKSPRWLQATAEILNGLAELMARLGRRRPEGKP